MQLIGPGLIARVINIIVALMQTKEGKQKKRGKLTSAMQSATFLRRNFAHQRNFALSGGIN